MYIRNDGFNNFNYGSRSLQSKDDIPEEESWEKMFRRLDEELERERRRSRREQKLIQEEKIRKKRIQKKLWEKLAQKRHLALQDEIRQINEQAALERAAGEDVYIKKAPLSKNLSVAEIMEIYLKV